MPRRSWHDSITLPPISCGGVVVNPADIVVADKGGVVIIPRCFAQQLHSKLVQAQSRLSTYLAAVKRGEFSNAWVDRELMNQHCCIED